MAAVIKGEDKKSPYNEKQEIVIEFDADEMPRLLKSLQEEGYVVVETERFELTLQTEDN